MVGEPRKIVLLSLFVGAVAITAYISQSDKKWLSTDELGLGRDNASTHYIRGDMVTGSVRSGPVVSRSDSAAAVAGDLRAARNSLQRNDLVSAQAQLDAVRSAHRDDDQVLALQREVAARTEQARHPLAVAHVQTPTPQRSKSARSSAPSSGKTGHTHRSYVAARDHSNVASSGYPKTRRAPEAEAAAVSTGNTSGGRASATAAPVVASSSSSEPVDGKVVSNETRASAAIQPIQATQPIPSIQSTSAPSPSLQSVPAPPAPQFAPAAGSLLKPDGGPKTRAQVRAEIARARADGSLPAFGNPDPAGPAGAPSLSAAPRP
ncbi:hypothetical protein R69927_01274 [Paraburkholderia domus]|jgi:RhoGEF, Guanine nucleotide exchange factor for Rho/Rac/Cdc42-like GTPases|uniref:DUF4148 domain-containing protein n=1 Tax=Paraburkholderia domus TaxID=2793075 RepID=A0A9N8MMS2_9BURK|nr:hypothetical protein R70006_01733 [Paraburkholderia domus]CAE6834365.1 hypothetical protein R69927_01274 [Paraburkholderia domus]CAE6837163.1 hypothetical protein R69749_04284 [Paraburkholderia domus]CAE6864299.1 hypothetical protein R70199_01087 [Paraburkholderia domus]CAE6874384.1 hypothetical protein R70211_01551 [Paraburkholderia domus]